MRALLTIVSLAAASLPPAPALARDTPATVFLARVQAPALEEATRRVAPELTAAGYRLSFEGCPPALEEGCRQPWPAGDGAVAAIDFAWVPEGLTIEARVARRDRRPVRLGTLVAGVPSPEPSVVAVRAAELVRAGVLAVMNEEAGTGVSIAAAAPARAAAAVGFFMSLGPGLVQSVGGLGSAVGPAVRAGVTWRGWFGAAWSVSPTLSGTVETPEGSVALRSDILGAELGRRWRPGARLQPSAALGGGVYHLKVRGEDVTPLTAATSALWTPFLSAAGGLAITLTPRWSIDVDVRAAVTRRAPVVRVGDSEAGRTGWPVLVAGLALAYRR